MIRLTHDSVEIRNFTPNDASVLFALTDKNRMYLREWLPWLDKIKTAEDTLFFINDSLDKFQAGTGADIGIWHEEVLVGVIGFHDIQQSNRKTTIGYWLDADSQGKGIMTTACSLLISYGFEAYKLNRIEIKCAPGNTKSSAIPVRLGFKKEGTLREVEWLYDHFVDHDVYSILSNEWLK